MNNPVTNNPATGVPKVQTAETGAALSSIPAVSAVDPADVNQDPQPAEILAETGTGGETVTEDLLVGLGSGNQSRRKRRRRRQAVLLVILVIVGVSAWVVSSGTIDVVEQETLAIKPIAMLEQMVFEVKRDSAIVLQVSDFEVDDSMVEQFRGLDSLETVIIDQGILTDASMDVFTSLPKLQHLRLRQSPITDEGLATLSRCESLQILNLPHAACSAQGIKQLKAIPKLRMIRLGAPKMGNEVTRELVEMKSLRSVHLIGIPVTNDGLKTLASIPHLESLYLDDSAVTESGWLWLFEQHPELHVHINQQHHDRDPHFHIHHD